MNQKNVENPKIFSRVSSDQKIRIERVAKEYGMTQSALISLCVGIGLNYLTAMTDPEALLSPEKMADILQEMDARGIDLKSPEIEEK